MKPDIHPTLHPVVFVDGDHEIITRSTKMSAETRDIDGVEHYVIPIDISAFTHPFFTGKQRLIDTEGRVERFRRKFGARRGAGVGSAPAPDNDAPSAAAGDAPSAADSAADSDGGSSE